MTLAEEDKISDQFSYDMTVFKTQFKKGEAKISFSLIENRNVKQLS